jgi:hypothetical protein
MATECPAAAARKPGARRRPILGCVSATPSVEGVERPPRGLRERLLAEPDRAPEVIALAAAERFAEPARRWAESMAAHGHPPDEAASIAVRRHVRLARVEGGIVGLGGAITAAADLVALVWLQSRMVFFVAAAYGFDPTHPMRPAELLALHDLYDTPASARAALDGVGESLAFAVVSRTLDRNRERTLRRRLLAFVGRKVAKRAAGRFVPIVASPLSAIQNGRLTADLGARTLRYYGG